MANRQNEINMALLGFVALGILMIIGGVLLTFMWILTSASFIRASSIEEEIVNEHVQSSIVSMIILVSGIVMTFSSFELKRMIKSKKEGYKVYILSAIIIAMFIIGFGAMWYDLSGGIFLPPS